MRPALNVWLPLLALALACSSKAQGLEDVIVEVYREPRHGVSPDKDPLKGYTTYRVFVDLAEGYQLQVVYGDDRHPLRIATTTTFYNDTIAGKRTGERIDGLLMKEADVLLDSYVSIGPASDRHWAVMLDDDPDGTIMEQPFSDPLVRLESAPLRLSDGLFAAPVPDLSLFGVELDEFHTRNSTGFETTNGAWAVLGGTKGPTARNEVLIAQLTTDGSISFELNLQIEAPDGTTRHYVARDPGDGEVLFEGLVYGM